jgi:large subunit ribosomal protein L23
MSGQETTSRKSGGGMTRGLAARRRAETMSRERMYTIIRSPLVTEKSTALSERNRVGFKVSLDATKAEIKKAVETLFNVSVVNVRTLIQKGKSKRFKGRPGMRSDEKKAYVQLAGDQSIDLTSKLA